MKLKMTNEAKTGAVVLICAAALLALVVKVGNYTLIQRGYTIKTRFHFTGGVKKHAPVCLSGVEVGEVKDIRILYGDQTLVETDLWLKEGVKVRQDSEAYSTTLGLMGEKYIEIRAGQTGEVVQDGGTIAGRDPVRLEDIVEIGTKVAGDISKMASDISSMARHVDEAVVDNRPKINNIFSNLEETSANFKEFSEDIKYHPWKILMKGREKSKQEIKKETEAKLAEKAKAQQNFSAKA